MVRGFSASIGLLAALHAASAAPAGLGGEFSAINSVTADVASNSRHRLSADLHRQLLLDGRPQIGLFKALTDEFEKVHEGHGGGVVG